MRSSVYACLSVFKSVRRASAVRAPRARRTCGRTAHACVPAYSSFVNTGGSKRVKHGGDHPASETLRNN